MRLPVLATESRRLPPGAVTALLSCGLILGLGAAELRKGIPAAIGAAAALLLGALLLRMRSGLVSVLVVMVYLLLLFPARLRIAPLGAAGTPGALIGMVAFTIWLYGFLFGRPWRSKQPQPIRWAMLGVAAAIMLSYIALGWRAHDVVEGKAADRGLMTLVSMAGMALLTADVIADRAALRRLLEAVVTGGTILSAIGIYQFASGVDLAAKVKVPGFTFVAPDYAALRSGFHRIVSTTSHPIELSVVLVLLLPLALHLGFTSAPGHRRRWWLSAGTIAATAPMTVSRTAVLALLVAALVLFPGWPPRQRRRVGLIALVGLVGMRFAIPGLIGTLKGALFHASNDPSLTSRQIGQSYVSTFIAQQPFFGRGIGTFIPQRYEFLDNQLLLTLVETGLVGLITLIALYVTAGWLTRLVRAVSPLEADRDLAQALLACLSVGLVTWLTYDALGFPTGRGMVFLLIGCSGALWRIVRDEHPDYLAEADRADRAPVGKSIGDRGASRASLVTAPALAYHRRRGFLGDAAR